MVDVPVRSSDVRQLRHRAGPWIDRVTKAFGQQTTHVYPPEYVGTVPRPVGRLEAELRDAEFSWDPVSAFHYTVAGKSTDGSWAYRSSPLADRQVHVVLVSESPGRTDVYAHDEYNWRRHPVKHAKEVDVRRREAVREVRRWLERHDVEYERQSAVRRWLGHAVGRLRERLSADSRVTRLLPALAADS